MSKTLTFAGLGTIFGLVVGGFMAYQESKSGAPTQMYASLGYLVGGTIGGALGGYLLAKMSGD